MGVPIVFFGKHNPVQFDVSVRTPHLRANERRVMELPENLDHHDWYHASKNSWNNVYRNAIGCIVKSANSEDDLDPALNLLLPFMESVYLLKRYEKTGELLLKGKWTDIHKEFFGDTLPRDYLQKLSGDFYNRIMHRGYIPETLFNLEFPYDAEIYENVLNRTVFTMLRIKSQGEQGRGYVVQVNRRLFIYFVAYRIDNFYNDTPIPEQFQSPVTSVIKSIISEDLLPEGSW